MYNKIILNQEFTLEKQLSRLEIIDFNEFIHFSKFFLSNYNLEGFFYGNINPIQSLKLINKLSSIYLLENDNLFLSIIYGSKKIIEYSSSFFYFLYKFFTGKIENQNNQLNSEKNLRNSLLSTKSSNSILNFQILDLFSLKKGSKIYYYKISKNYDSAVLMQIITGYSNFKNYILTKILTSIISTLFFKEIGLEKQLGYTVRTQEEGKNSHLSGIYFYVVSNRKNVKILAKNILQFWNELFYFNSTKIKETSFNTVKESILDTLNEPEIYATEKFFYFSSKIEDQTNDFNEKNKTIHFVRKLKYYQFLQWLKHIYKNSNIFLYAVQSPYSEEKATLDYLSNYAPQNFTKFNCSDSLFNHKNIKTYSELKIHNEI
ncbi:hypothetical protein CPHLJ_5g5512 [Cryptosporidium parvum]